MSGGSLDYLYSKVQDVADQLSGASNPLHGAFGLHLRKVAKALHDLEWFMSCDYSSGDEEEAIRAVIQPADELACATKKAEEAAAQLANVLERVRT
jgi:hypothetical protein